MSNGALPDPAAMFRDMLSQWEKTSNELANKAMQSSEFGRTMHQITNASLAAQNAASDAMAKFLLGMNLPSRADLLSVAAQVQAVDDRLMRIEALLLQSIGATIATPRATMPRPPRTRKPAAQ